MNKALRLLGVLFLFSPLLYSQEKSRIYVTPLVSDGFSEEETRNIEALLFSYLGDIGILARQDESNFTLGGRLRLDENSRFLDLEIQNLESGEQYFRSYPFKNFGELVLKARTLITSVFSPEKPPNFAEIPEALLGERLSPERIRGTWRSGGGIQIIRLERDGNGTMLFSSGAVMRLRYTMENNILTILQNSPNNERFYHHLPQKTARELAQIAEPMRWEFVLFNQGSALRGIVIFTDAIYEGDSLIEVNHGKTDSAEWLKTR